MPNLLRKPVFEFGNVDWISEPSSSNKEYNNTIHSSTKITPTQLPLKKNEKKFDKLQNEGEKQKPSYIYCDS